MVGEVVNIYPVNDKYDILGIKDTEGNIMSITVDKLDKDYLGKRVSVQTTITEIVNANLNYEYPEGTLGTPSFKKSPIV